LQPPAEERQATLREFPNLRLTGTEPSEQERASILEYEKTHEDHIMFFSEVWLDNKQVLLPYQKFQHILIQQVLERLGEVFREYEETPPSMIVMIGNFSSRPHGPTATFGQKEGSDTDSITSLFATLAAVLKSFPNIISKTQFPKQNCYFL